jgi:hypothetical protein
MALILEDGSGILLANSYARDTTYEDYCDDRGYTIPSGDAETALVRGTMFVDSYRARFPGYRTKQRLQGLEWPRVGAYTTVPSAGREYPYPYQNGVPNYQFYGVSYIASNEIPIEIIYATYEAALREQQVPGSMQPDLERGGMVKSLKAGSVEIVYMDGATPKSTTQLIDGILSGLLLPSNLGWFATSARG